MDGWWGFVGVVVGAVITGIVSIGGEYLRNQHESDLDEKKRADNRNIDATRFQKENLLDLQVRLAHWIRAEGRAMHADRMALRAAGTLTLLPTDVSDEILETQRELVYRIERVKDASLRRDMNDLTALMASQGAAWAIKSAKITEADIDAAEGEFGRRVAAIHIHLGDVLRQYL